jgi:sigma-B regulation protein RsbU (phosphoserine phosphatase)
LVVVVQYERGQVVSTGQGLTHPIEDSGGFIRNVLVVDDSSLQRKILASSMKKRGFDVEVAESGLIALEKCKARMPDLVLSDWMMPEMDGLEFCRALRELQGENYSYFILLTSKSEKDDIAVGLDAGADDFLTKPVSPAELRARISAGERIIAMQRELSEKNRLVSETLGKLQKVYDSIDRDLKQARTIQESLVPELTRDFGKSRVSLLLKPSGHIGGDLVGMFSPSENKLGFYSIDVSGHGITSAMMTARLGGYLSSSYFDQNVGVTQNKDGSYRLREPVDVIADLNNRLMADTGIEEYFTIAYATADLRTGKVKLVQAGHPHPLLIRADQTLEFVGEGGVPVGLVPGVEYAQIELDLNAGDKLLLYSDGFTECILQDDQMLEQSGLAQLVENSQSLQNGQEFLDDLFWDLTQIMSPEKGMDDDVSATIFEYFGP